MTESRYREAPQQAPYVLGDSKGVTKKQRDIQKKEYMQYCVDRVLGLPSVVGVTIRPDLVIDGTWDKQKVESQLSDQLRNLATLIENHLALPKELR
jgi:hypothetical protein